MDWFTIYINCWKSNQPKNNIKFKRIIKKLKLKKIRNKKRKKERKELNKDYIKFKVGRAIKIVQKGASAFTFKRAWGNTSTIKCRHKKRTHSILLSFLFSLNERTYSTHLIIALVVCPPHVVTLTSKIRQLFSTLVCPPHVVCGRRYDLWTQKLRACYAVEVNPTNYYGSRTL